MADWGILIAIIIIAVISWATTESVISNYLAKRRIIKAGRTIPASDALHLHQVAVGAIVRNHSTMPGRWWFYFYSDKPPDYDLWMTLNKYGKLVMPRSATELRSLDSLEGKVEDVFEPFED